MATIIANQGKITLFDKDKIVTLSNFSLGNVETFIPDLKLEQQIEPGDSKEKSEKIVEDSIYCISTSSCGNFLAISTDKKQLIVFQNNKLGKSMLSRKASKMVFTNTDSGYLVVADKNGDVYSLDISQHNSKPKLILGHLSMLLDICLTEDDRHVLTADRDEKIRVSHFPNSYNIETFCLGHTDFVTSISLMDDGFLVSGSGDGSVRVWKYLDGKEMKMRFVYKDVEIPANKEENVEKQIESMNVDPKRSGPSDTPAVIKVKSFNRTSFIVQIEGLDGCVVYNYDPLDSNINVVQILKFDNRLLDFSIDGDSVIFLTHTKETESILSLLQYKIQDNKLTETGSLQISKEIVAFTSGNSNGDLESLHKRWFDNMKDYLERKQIRLEQRKSKVLALKESSETPAKKLKTVAS